MEGPNLAVRCLASGPPNHNSSKQRKVIFRQALIVGAVSRPSPSAAGAVRHIELRCDMISKVSASSDSNAMLSTYTAKYTRIRSGYMGQLLEWPEVITEGKTLD